MRVLVACEESQRVCQAFRRKGHEAYSCDLLPCGGGAAEWHIQGDVLPLLDGHCNFKTADGVNHRIDERWDMILAFPPCTHLAVSGARHFEKKYDDGRQLQAIWFFAQFLKADCDKICIENPVNIISGDYIKKKFPYHCEKFGLPATATQIIQPYWFGDPAEKKTCLWLKGLPMLKETNVVTPPDRVRYDSGKSLPKWYADAWRLPKEERAIFRSKTFPGIAKAMAEQWG